VSNPNQINVSSQRANEIFQGKAATAIKDLMVENSALSAVCEAVQQALSEKEAELTELRAEVDQLRAEIAAPVPAPPQSFDDTVPTT
jgi:hypothetical protein